MSDVIKIFVREAPSIIKVIQPAARQLIKVFAYNVVERLLLETPYTKALGGSSVTVEQSEHLLTFVRGFRVNKITGEEVEVNSNISGNTVTIDSNVSLEDHILTIY